MEEMAALLSFSLSLSSHRPKTDHRKKNVVNNCQKKDKKKRTPNRKIGTASFADLAHLYSISEIIESIVFNTKFHLAPKIQ